MLEMCLLRKNVAQPLELLLNLRFMDRKQICIICESITKQNTVLGHYMKDKLQKWQADNITSPI